MMSEAVTVPPGVLMRSTRPRTFRSFAAFFSSSRMRTSIGTRTVEGPSPRPPDGASSVMKPETSIRRIFASPRPSTTCSSSGRTRGVRSTDSTEQPASVTRARRSEVARSIAASILAPHGRLDDVHAAARRLRNRIHRTPVVSCQSMDDATGFAVFLKCENLQRAGAFKIRGTLDKLLSLTADERRRGVVAFSSGNHAQGVALAAQMTGTTSIICMPSDAPKLKLEATRRYGAEVVFYDRQRDDREAVARALAEKTDRVLVPPYDDYAIMAGQGTAALELFQDVPSLDALLAPVGGGGLMAGCSIVARTLFPGIQILGVETDTANDTHLSLRKGERETIPPPPTIADGIRITTPGALTFPVLKANVNDVVLVSDDEVCEAVRFLALRAHVVTEPTGAVAAAAVLSRRLPLPAGARVGVVLSGGNVDPDVLGDILRG